MTRSTTNNILLLNREWENRPEGLVSLPYHYEPFLSKTSAWFCSSWQIVGSTFQLFRSLRHALFTFQCTGLSLHWCSLRKLHEFCLMLLCLCFPFIQPFITLQLPDLNSEPHWASWCTDLSWVRCEIWIGCMCEYGCEFDVSVYHTCFFCYTPYLNLLPISYPFGSRVLNADGTLCLSWSFFIHLPPLLLLIL